MGGPAATLANYRISSTDSKMLPQPPYKTALFDLRVKRVNSKGLYHGWLLFIMPSAHPYSLWNSLVSKNMPAPKRQTLHTTNTAFDNLLIRLTKTTKTNYCKTRFNLS